MREFLYCFSWCFGRAFAQVGVTRKAIREYADHTSYRLSRTVVIESEGRFFTTIRGKKW